MSWLLRDDEVLAQLDIADDRRSRRRGLLGRDGIDGALLLRPCRSVHSMGMRFSIDVAYCARDGDMLAVLVMRTMPPRRLGLPVWKAHAVIEAEAGAFSRWGLKVGDRLEIR